LIDALPVTLNESHREISRPFNAMFTVEFADITIDPTTVKLFGFPKVIDPSESNVNVGVTIVPEATKSPPPILNGPSGSTKVDAFRTNLELDIATNRDGKEELEEPETVIEL
jgi:hypothetical protein